MLSYCVLLTCLIHSLFAVELSIYKSFTEVRQTQNGIGNIKYSFTENDFNNVVDGSISWDGTQIIRQEIYSQSQSLKDAQVTVRRSSKCDCEVIQAKIVDPDNMLLQNLKTRAYFYADKQAVEYTSVRPAEAETILELEFQSPLTPHSGLLSYLAKGITWTPSYELLLSGNNDYKLRAFATIENSHKKEYAVEMTRLLGGDVPLANEASSSRFDKEMAMRPSVIRPIESAGEMSGLYAYNLNNQYTLRPSSSIRLPFIDITATYQFYYKAVAGINSGVSQGVFQRNYDITPDHFMPAGVITVRDNKVLVGQAALPDVPENYTQTFTVGQDNDVRYVVKNNMTSKSDDKAEIAWQQFEVQVEVKNFKNKNVNTQLEFQGGVQITLHNTTCKSVTTQGNQLRFPVQLEASSSRSCKFTATVTLN